MIVSGEAVATKTIEAGQPPKEVMSYKVGDYFGELALLKNEPRAANVIAKVFKPHMFLILLKTIYRLIAKLLGLIVIALRGYLDHWKIF